MWPCNRIRNKWWTFGAVLWYNGIMINDMDKIPYDQKVSPRKKAFRWETTEQKDRKKKIRNVRNVASVFALAAFLNLTLQCSISQMEKHDAQMITLRQFEYFYENHLGKIPVEEKLEDVERDFAAFKQDKELQEQIARESGIGLEQGAETVK